MEWNFCTCTCICIWIEVRIGIGVGIGIGVRVGVDVIVASVIAVVFPVFIEKLSFIILCIVVVLSCKVQFETCMGIRLNLNLLD
jgi:hypothetical protein